MNKQQSFSQRLLSWYDQHGRKNLPWHKPRQAYQVWVSEIMLQQTQVQTVLAYFERFMLQFPDLEALATADEDEVLSLWSGLGYYSRARNLHKTAQIILSDYQGKFPKQTLELIKLPGIGASTAAAIASQAFNQPAAILDGNVKRVLSRYFQIDGWPQQATVHKKLLALAEQCLPTERFADYTQAIMDLGALCCTPKKPSCDKCPIHQDCQAYNNQLVSQYPAKKPSKAIPSHAWQFLLIHNRSGQIYLEKRPPVGLWGGLWCLPHIDLNDCPQNYLHQQHAIKAAQVHDLITFKHRFSHFHLTIHAKSILAGTTEFQLQENTGTWFEQNQLNQLGLAKPVSLILQQWFSQPVQ